MKKYILLALILNLVISLFTFGVERSSFSAETSTLKGNRKILEYGETGDNVGINRSSVSTNTTSTSTDNSFSRGIEKKDIRRGSAQFRSLYAQCVNQATSEVRKEYNQKIREARSLYRNEIKSATSSKAKIEARRKLNKALKDLNKEFVQKQEDTKLKCKELKNPISIPTSIITPNSTSTSTKSNFDSMQLDLPPRDKDKPFKR